MHIGRAGKCVDDDDDDSGLTEQRDCLRGAAPGGERKSKPRQRQILSRENQLDFFAIFFLMFLNFLTVEKCKKLIISWGKGSETTIEE